MSYYDQILKAIRMEGHYELSSGLHSDTYYDTDLLFEWGVGIKIVQDIYEYLKVKRIMPDLILGVPRSGIWIAEMLNKCFQDENDFRVRGRGAISVLVVENVITTGRSILKYVEKISSEFKLKFGFIQKFCLIDRRSSLPGGEGHRLDVESWMMADKRDRVWKAEECIICDERKSQLDGFVENEEENEKE